MELEKKQHSTGQKIMIYLAVILRILLSLSIFFLVLSCILMIAGGFENEIYYGIMWSSVMASVLIYYFSIASLVGISIFYKINKVKVWQKIKIETIMLMISISCFVALGLINNYIL